MKYQTNPELGPFINKWGCHFCSILEKVEKRGKVKFTNAETVEVYELCMSAWAVQREEKSHDGSPLDGCTVLNGAAVFNIAAKYKGPGIRAKDFRHAPVHYYPAKNEEEILECEYPGHPGVHFMSGTGVKSPGRWQDEIEFDPIEGGSNTAKLGRIKSKRIISF